MKSLYKNIKGTKDILPKDCYNIKKIEDFIHKILQSYGYGEIRTPFFETTNLFIRGIGESTDIVSKEMYSWIDQGGYNLTLRPELTAPVIRAYNQHQLSAISPITKLYYLSSLFRRERPQKGRQRQFSQFGVEAIGSEYPEQDAEVISIAHNVFKSLKVDNINVRINTIGSADIRGKYIQELKKSLNKFSNDLSETDNKRLKNNALRLFDSKDPICQKILDENAPFIYDYISDKDLNHFNKVLELLDSLNIPYTHDKKLVRGLDYYTNTTFEICSESLGAQDALCGGGRYNKLVEQLGGKPTAAIGFAAGLERLLIVLNNQDKCQPIDIYIILIGEKSINKGLLIAEKLRNKNLSVNVEMLRRSMKSQMRDANKLNAKFTIMLGENELDKNEIIVRNMVSRKQDKISLDDIYNFTFIKNQE